MGPLCYGCSNAVAEEENMPTQGSELMVFPSREVSVTDNRKLGAKLVIEELRKLIDKAESVWNTGNKVNRCVRMVPVELILERIVELEGK